MTAIDLSYAQTTNIDFVALRAAGVDTVILKATGSNTGSQYVDSKYRYFEPRARAAGMRMGHYHFNGYGDPVSDANFFVNNLYGYQPNDLLALDIESENPMPYWTPPKANAFLDQVVARLGRYSDVYMSSSVTSAQNWASTRDRGSALWVAQYGTNNGSPQGAPRISYWPTYKLWQYSSNGSVPGYAGRLDVNIVNESQWAGGGSTPLPLVETDDGMPKNYNSGGTIFTLGDSWGKRWTNTTDFSYLTNMAIYGAPIVVSATLDQINTAISEANARGAAYSQVGTLTDAQIASISAQIAANLGPSTGATADQVTQIVTSVVNGAVVNLAQNNVDQTAAIKAFKYSAS